MDGIPGWGRILFLIPDSSSNTHTPMLINTCINTYVCSLFCRTLIWLFCDFVSLIFSLKISVSFNHVKLTAHFRDVYHHNYIQLQCRMQRVPRVIHMDSCMLWMMARNSPRTFFNRWTLLSSANTCVADTLQ